MTTFLVLCLSLTLFPKSVQSVEFNYELEKRIVDMLNNYLSQSVDTNLFLSNYRFSGGFQNDLTAQDRDEYLVLDNALLSPLVYYGLEDGSITGFYKAAETSIGYYREPGNSGYAADDPLMEKHLKSCIDGSGSQVDCLLSPGNQYIQCIEDCKLELCPDEDSQADCQSTDEECLMKQKWCPQYTIATLTEEEDQSEKRGYIPLTNYCHDMNGRFTQEEGMAVKVYTPSTYDLSRVVDPDGQSTVHQLSTCYHSDGTTPVNRTLSGEYAFCGGKDCDNTFAGGYSSYEYDPRYRPWYIQTKDLQKPIWMDPFIFFGSDGKGIVMGITVTQPIYDAVDGKNVFAGVLAVDYRFEDIANFLIDSYKDTTTSVAIFEDKEPYHIIALSTGTPSTLAVLSADPTQPCPESGDAECQPVRLKMSDLADKQPSDVILSKAMQKHKDQNFPAELITVRESKSVGSDFYLSQSVAYEQKGAANLRWRVIINSPNEISNSDSIEVGNPLFGVIFAIGLMGFAICAGFFTVFFRKRHKKAVIYADWRFTCAFIIGCALFNCSSLTLVGPNIDSMCLLRAWSFHLLSVATLAPLFVKIWRLWKLIGSSNIRRKVMSHGKTAAYMLPMISIQVVILTIISIVDPPLETEEIRISEGVVTQHIVCAHNTNALAIIEIIYQASLVIVGCVLAFQTRNMDTRFGESKSLIFAMYTWALFGLMFVILIPAGNFSPNSISIIQCVAIFWVTVSGSAAFVIPRLIQVRKDDNTRRNGGSGGTTRISGLSAPDSFNRVSSVGSAAAGSSNNNRFSSVGSGMSGAEGGEDFVCNDEEAS